MIVFGSNSESGIPHQGKIGNQTKDSLPPKTILQLATKLNKHGMEWRSKMSRNREVKKQ